MKNKIKFYTIFITTIISVFLFISQSYWTDILSKVFDDVNWVNNWQLIYLWETSQSVWHSLLRQQTAIWSNGYWRWFYQEAPVIVRVVKTILNLTIILAVPMIIFNAVKLMIEVFKSKSFKSAEAKKDLLNVIYWLLIALSSILIINLIVSASKTIIEETSYNHDVNIVANTLI